MFPPVLKMQPSGITPRTQLTGYTLESRPTTVPGFSTLLQPTSTPSPSRAPTYFRPVGSSSPWLWITTSALSLFTLLVMDPAPMWAL